MLLSYVTGLDCYSPFPFSSINTCAIDISFQFLSILYLSSIVPKCSSFFGRLFRCVLLPPACTLFIWHDGIKCNIIYTHVNIEFQIDSSFTGNPLPGQISSHLSQPKGEAKDSALLHLNVSHIRAKGGIANWVELYRKCFALIDGKRDERLGRLMQMPETLWTQISENEVGSVTKLMMAARFYFLVCMMTWLANQNYTFCYLNTTMWQTSTLRRGVVARTSGLTILER